MTPLLNIDRKRRQVYCIHRKKQEVEDFMERITISSWLPVSWACNLPSASFFARQRLFSLVLALLLLELIVIAVVHRHLWSFSATLDHQFVSYLPRVRDLEATDTGNLQLNYGIVVDCGSSGSRVFVYVWPQHNGNPHDLLDIKQMRDQSGKPVVKKIQPGISTMAASPDKASDYMQPLLSFAAAYIPASKHKETPLHILCTAGMRLLPENQQAAILQDLVNDVPLEFDFLFPASNAEVISGELEGLFAWISINYVLGRFNHAHKDAMNRRQTVGVLDMGGGSLQIAYEVPISKTSSPDQEAAEKAQLAEVNLGWDLLHTGHGYRVYVKTFLGFGGNFARQRYEDMVYKKMIIKNKVLNQHTGERPDYPYMDPCLPDGATTTISKSRRPTFHIRGKGDWIVCQKQLQSLFKSKDSPASLNAHNNYPVDFSNSEFYAFSEFYYSTEDVLRLGGPYNSEKFANAAQEHCSKTWSTLHDWFKKGLYTARTDEHRLRYQCFKSAWVYQVLHYGFHFPQDYTHLQTARSVRDQEMQWTLGAILLKTRFLALRRIHQGTLHPAQVSPGHSSFIYNHHLLFACIVAVLMFIALHILWPRRPHHGQAVLVWMEEIHPLDPELGL